MSEGGLATEALRARKVCLPRAGRGLLPSRRRQFRKTGFTTKGAAASAVAELKTKLDKGTYVKPTARTLGEYATEWLPRRERSDKGLRETTVAGHKYYIRDDIAPSACAG